MGNCVSNPARAQSNAIDKSLADEGRKLKNECKILLLGAGESGKSTIVKQMKIIHHNGFSDQELETSIPIIRRNLLDSLRVMLHVLDEAERKPDGVPSGVSWQSGKWFVERAVASSYLSHVTDETSSSSVTCVDPPNPAYCEEDQPDQVGRAVEKIWLDPVVQRLVEAMCSTYTSASGLQLMDNASFFLSAATRILPTSYLPEAQDILLSRAKSTEVKETRFTMGTLSIHLFDVGGQRSERRKWIHCFGGVTSIIFCTALSEYDQVLEEDETGTQNRMHESLDLFKSVIRSQWFLRTSIILFLNKADVFKKKLPKTPLSAFFPEYIGGDDVKKGVKFVWWKYMQIVKQHDKARVVYPHVTQATDTNTIHKVFLAVKETILQKNLHESGIL